MKERAYQCSFYWVGRGGGRCARGGGRTDRHHVVKRSEAAEKCEVCRGRGAISTKGQLQECPECLGMCVEAKALADICPPCHNAIHDEKLTRFRFPSGVYCYVDGPRKAVEEFADVVIPTTDQEVVKTMLQHHGWRVALLWNEEDGMGLESTLGALSHGLSGAVSEMDERCWRIAHYLYMMEVSGDAWQLLGHRQLNSFLNELGIPPRQAKSYLAAERMLMSGRIEASHAIEFHDLPISILTGKGLEAVEAMTSEQIDTLLEQAKHLPAFHVVQEAVLAAGVTKTKDAGKRHANVTLQAKGATLEVNVAFVDGEDPVKVAQKLLELKNRPGTISWGNATWEETK